MKKCLLTSTIILIYLNAFSQIPVGYYEGTSGLSGFTLKSKLNKIISTKPTSWNYSHLPSYYILTDSDHYYEDDGTMLDIYSENPDGIDPYTYAWDTAELISGASTEGLGYNREHVISQSFFGGCYPMYSDIHFVIPTDARVNQRRSNLPFGEVGSSVSFTSLNGTKVGISSSDGYTLTVFEPIDEFKGDIARMIFYAAVRYEHMIQHFDTANTRNPFYNNAEIAIRPWLLKVLKEWHIADPVSTREIDRNNNIYNIQGNRNPFVDHPEFVNLIWPSTTSSDTTPPEIPIYLSAPYNGAHFINMTWEPAADADVLGYEIKVNGDIFTRTSTHAYTLHHLTPETDYFVEVRSYDKNYNFSDWSLTYHAHTEAADTFSKDLMITKIIEGTNYNKAIELYNNTGYTIQLSNYTLGMRQVNASTGALYWSDNELRLEGSLEHGKRLVIIHPQAELDCLDIHDADIISAATPLQFDGKMAIRLKYDTKTIDMFGAPDNREPFALNQSLYRKPTIRQPQSTFNYEEWIYHDVDYCEGIGDNTTNIENSYPSTQFNLYPNPIKVGENINIDLKESHPIITVEIYNLLGQSILSVESHNAQHISIPTSTLTPNVYLLNINNTIHKIIITE